MLRNIAIIAHVDHGKTTLIDSLMKQTGIFRKNQVISDRLMDSGDLEKERGITILAKPTSIIWKETRINIIDTPGHSDFGGEVERVLGMTDGVVLLVDAAEGPMPQTKFVLGKALAQGLMPIVVVNKVDRSDSRSEEVVNEVFDLFVDLDADEKQLDFPVLYSSGRDGWCVNDLSNSRQDLSPLLDLILIHIKAPKLNNNKPFAMLATLLASDPYLGRCLIGRVEQGKVSVNANVKTIDLKGNEVEKGRLTKLFIYEGTEKVPVNQVQAGDIICIAGLNKSSVADTICDDNINSPINATAIDPPTMAVTITVNSSPFAGTEGKLVTSTKIRERLLAEAESNVAITFNENSNKDAFEIGGRGELQIGILIETMRREGFELSISSPRVLLKKNEKGEILEPIEEVIIDVDEQYSSSTIDSINKRKGEMIEMKSMGKSKTRLLFKVPSRGLIGYHGQFLTETRGTGVLNRIFYSYDIFKGIIKSRRNGVLIATEQGNAIAYALFNIQERGKLFIGPQAKVYQGMVIGENSRENDLEVNVLKGKKLTNIRASGTDEAVKLSPPLKMSLEEMMSFIKEDELLEITPKNLRLRKKFLDSVERKRSSKL
ncbi:MAG: translational GTPase TypA [Pelagibacterales bacterium]|nr:translational GTPase TypA [Pelagibacterales bacterium]OUU63427.1 MAG: translational GTPase TypA [Alphaproteobacteria bacterium TMED62]|tara:strand:- start:635 stop:2440 length:1806 start_codon:yes stop_codon:yes gene_type:complete